MPTEDGAPIYSAKFTRQFYRATRKANERELKACLEALLNDPYRANGTHPLKHAWAGYRGADFDKTHPHPLPHMRRMPKTEPE